MADATDGERQEAISRGVWCPLGSWYGLKPDSRDLHSDRPARTVTCRNLAGATSDVCRIRLPDGRRRRLTVREGARLQGFPRPDL